MARIANNPPSPIPATQTVGHGDELPVRHHKPKTQGDGSDVLHHKPKTHDDGLGLRHRKPEAFSTSAAIIARARDELEDLIGYKVDSVSGFEKTDGGWRLAITALELCRIPATTDVLASYEVLLNGAGDIINYHRDKRYLRNQVGEAE